TSLRDSCATVSWLLLLSVGIIAVTIEQFIHLSRPDFLSKKARPSLPDGEPLQSFTAIGSIASGEIYQVEMSPDFKPFRVDVRFSTCREAPIKPMIDKLSFITNKTHWGAGFRFGHLKIPATDFALIAKAMGCSSLAGNAL
ncbi:MAG: EVE domain-containing protein, partial [Casimicrobiaceae bacterium]